MLLCRHQPVHHQKLEQTHHQPPSSRSVHDQNRRPSHCRNGNHCLKFSHSRNLRRQISLRQPPVHVQNDISYFIHWPSPTTLRGQSSRNKYLQVRIRLSRSERSNPTSLQRRHRSNLSKFVQQLLCGPSNDSQSVKDTPCN